VNAENLIAEVADIVLGETTDEVCLAALNAAQMAIAERVLLPGLSDGLATISATTGAMYATIPATYHRRIFMAKNTTTGSVVDVYSNIGIMAQITEIFPSIDNEGDVISIALHSGRILYQRVPTSTQSISLMFYRLPVDMEDSSTSYPDGMGGSRVAGSKEAIDFALIHHAAWNIFEKIEDGMEGAKVNSTRHQGLFEEHMERLSLVCRQEEVQARPMFNRSW